MKLIEKYIKYTSVILIASLIVWWFNNGSIISLLNTEMFGEFDFAVTVLVITLVISIALCDNRVSGILSTRFFPGVETYFFDTIYDTLGYDNVFVYFCREVFCTCKYSVYVHDFYKSDVFSSFCLYME